jgi:histone-lysine N-methyltransferase SUV420H
MSPFDRHLRRYLLPLQPASRLEIHTTSRYTSVSGHTELAIFATRNLASGSVLQELQGSVVPLPDAWREEMEIGEDFAVRAAGEATSDEEADEDDYEHIDESDEEYEAEDENGSQGGAEDSADEEDDNDNDNEDAESRRLLRARKGKGKEKENERSQRGARRSDRTKRRDFSIVWSGLKRCYQLFLGPARFLNAST